MESQAGLLTQIADLRARLTRDLPSDEVGQIDLIAALEGLKSTACAAQARASSAFAEARPDDTSLASQVALARKVSPHRGRTLLGMARILCTEMRSTLDRLTDGTIDEYKALVLVKETSCLDLDTRAAVDATLCGSPAELDGVGVRELERRVKQIAYELEPAAFVKRRSQAEGDRHVTLRPAPDTMAYLTALLPVEQGVAAFKALTDGAAALAAAGDPRCKGQPMADLLVQAAVSTGSTTLEESTTPVLPVCVNITLPTETLAGGNTPAVIEGIPVPAETARRLISKAIVGQVGAWFRRLYVDPGGRLVAMSSRQRLYDKALAEFLDLRDLGTCRMPYCDAPIRHHDHVRPVKDGGETSAANGQGLCVRCNLAKDEPGWGQQVTGTPARHQVETTTPTGHRHISTAPRLPGVA